MGGAVNAQPGYTEKTDFSDNGFMSVPLLDLMKDNSGYDRTFKRYRVSFPLRVQAAAEDSAGAVTPEGNGENWPGLAHNISISGIGFVCPSQFELADMSEIEVTLGDRVYRLLARIRWRRQLNLPDGSMYNYGAQFLRTDSVLEFIPAAAEFLLSQDTDRFTGRGSISMPGPSPREPQAVPA